MSKKSDGIIMIHGKVFQLQLYFNIACSRKIDLAPFNGPFHCEMTY